MLHVSDEQFTTLVEEGIAAIPERFLKKLDNVALVIADAPTRRQRKQMRLLHGDTLLGLYEGIPQPDRWNYAAALPDKITIFKLPILEDASSEEEVREIVKETVWHEIAHHFGLDDEEIDLR